MRMMLPTVATIALLGGSLPATSSEPVNRAAQCIADSMAYNTLLEVAAGQPSIPVAASAGADLNRSKNGFQVIIFQAMMGKSEEERSVFMEQAIKVNKDRASEIMNIFEAEGVGSLGRLLALAKARFDLCAIEFDL